MDKTLLDIKQVASLLNISTSTVRRLIRGRKLKGILVGSQWRFDAEEIKNAIENGRLPAQSVSAIHNFQEMTPLPSREWAESLISRWRSFINQIINEFAPEHVIVLDRRGAKIWSYLLPSAYVWGKNLWHSNALDYMNPVELEQICFGEKILLFDEMIQHGREMFEARRRLIKLGAEVESLVLVRRKSHAEMGVLAEYSSHYCEDLDDHNFSLRLSQISELLRKAHPPLDVDHLVVKGVLEPGLAPDEFLLRLAD